MQIRLAIAAALFCAWSAFALFLGTKWERANGASREAKLLSDQVAAVRAEQAVDREDRKKLQKTLDGLPRPQGKINEAVTKHPSRCQLDPAVVDVLQDAIRKANAARALPSNP